MRHRNAFAGWLVTVVMVNLCVAAGPPVTPASVSGLRDKVAAAVARDVPSRLPTTPDGGNLQVLDPLLCLPSDVRLRVASVRAGYTPGTWVLRLQCSSRRDCLPFDVLLREPGTGGRESSGGVRASGSSASSQPAQLPRSELVARSGDRLLLVEERSGLRLKVTALCLQSGGLGDHIRVRNLASQRVLLATVAGKNLVRVE